jgi:alkaline phosphatase
VKTRYAAIIALLILTPIVRAGDPEIKNIVLMISDGQGFNTVRATEYYTGRNAVYERFEHRWAMQTHSAGHRNGYTGRPYDPAAMAADFNYAKSGATDSAAAATALYTGVNAYDNEINVTPGGTPLETLFEKAARAGRSIGAVSSVPFVHATPAAVYGHSRSRMNYPALAKEAIYGRNPGAHNMGYDAQNHHGMLKVILAPGNPEYDNDAGRRSLPSYGLIGDESHWRDLSAGASGWTLISTLMEFEALGRGNTPDRVFGLPHVYETLQQRRGSRAPRNDKTPPQAVPANEGVPDLATMARGALNVLDNNPAGFALMIEGGAVDWANHDNDAGRMIEEQIDFNRAVEAVVEYLDRNTGGNNWSNTLLVVTADHECGYLWGDARVQGSTFFDVNGNGTFYHGVDYAHVKDNGAGRLPALWYHSGNHSNSLVPFYARGAGSDSFERYVIGVEPNLRTLYDLDEGWSGRYIDNTAIFRLLESGSFFRVPRGE